MRRWQFTLPELEQALDSLPKGKLFQIPARLRASLRHQ